MPPTTTLSTLESHLWEAANILRGSPVDRSDWKSYILPLMFFKRICDVWDEEYEEAVKTYGEDFADEHRFVIPEGNHWDDVREKASNVGTALQNAMRGIESDNQKHLYGVFGDSQWTNKDRLPDALLKDLLEHFSALNLSNSHVDNDIIGDGYEFLIKKFADATNNKAGEFYTPRSVVRLMVDILDPKAGETVYDPACGTGGMLLGAVEHVRAKGGDPRTFYGKLYGQEKNLTTASVARMNLLLHGMEDFVVERGDTLRNPVFTDPSTGGLATFDCVIANPPFSLEQWGRDIWESDPWGRSFAGLPTDSNADFAWVQHMVKSMAEKSGRMAVVLPQGTLFRGGVEGQIRKYLLEQDWVETVIGLAPNLFYGTGLAACVLILKKKKSKERKNKVLIVDASSLMRKGIEYLEQALGIAREIGNLQREGLWLGNIGAAYSYLGEWRKAIDYYERALGVAREIGDRQNEGNWLGNLGSAYGNLGEWRKGTEFFEQALGITREIGDRKREGNWLGNLGSAYGNLGEWRKGIEYFEQALGIAREIGDRQNEEMWLGGIGVAYVNLGEQQKAIECYEQALGIAHEIGDRQRECEWLNQYGELYIKMSDAVQAKENLDRSLIISRELGSRELEAKILFSFAKLSQFEQNKESALQYAQDARSIFESLKSPQIAEVTQFLESLNQTP